MDKKNEEIDKVLKEKMQQKLNPSPEFELNVIRMVEKEKQKMSEEKNKTAFTKVTSEEDKKIINKPKGYKNFAKILSMAAVIIMVFTLGMNLKTAPIVGDEQAANLISIKAIEPTKLESGVLANNSEFIIQAEGDNLNTESIQKSIYIEPALEYTIEKTLNKNEYKLKFKQNIPDNTILKLQYVKNQITENSWAYQTANKLSVTRTYPGESNNGISKNSVIEIEFSYATVENFEKFVSITPAVDGEWKHIGNIWRFTHKSALQENQTYKVKINKGLTAGEQKLKENYTFSFLVGNTESAFSYRSITVDKIITVKPNELAKIGYSKGYSESQQYIKKVEIRKFSNLNDFIEYVEDSNYEKATKLKEYEFKNMLYQGRSEGFLELNNTLPKGYFVAIAENEKGKEYFNCPIQVCDISAYAMETERSVLVWAANGNDLAQNVSVEYLGKTIKTNNQGIAKFEEIADDSEKVKYAIVNNELVIGIYNFDLDEYPKGYIYTDRPLYKNTDTINIWGFVPKKLFFDKVEEEFYIQLGEEGKQKVAVDENGNFVYKLELKNHLTEDETQLFLYYKEKIIATRIIAIKNYELQNYIYDIITNQKYVKAGDTIKFDVKVTHITGLIVPNKNVTIKIGENHLETKKTGENGIAHFEIKTEEDNEDIRYNLSYQEIEVYNGDQNEYTTADTTIHVPVVQGDTHIEEKSDTDKEYKIQIYKLDKTRNTDISWDLHELYNGAFETNVDINLIETAREKYISEYVYNEYTKENEPVYEYMDDSKVNVTKLKTVNSKNGIAKIDRSEIKTKKDTETMKYSYDIEFSYKDTSGKMMKNLMSYYENEIFDDNDEGYYYSNDSVEGEGNSDRLYETNRFIDPSYEMYRYLLKDKDEYKTYNIGEKIELQLAEYTKTEIKEIQNQGKLLSIVFKENIYDATVLTDSNFTHNCTEKDFPGFKLTSAYFVNGKFYRMPVKYYNFDEESRKVDVEITTDKEQYKPGETVQINIKTTNKGNPIKTSVNISVANEAVFEIEDDSTDLIHSIYSTKDYAAYTYSSYLDLLKSPIQGGAGGGGGSVRAKFADTAHFELITTDKNGNAKVSFKLPDNTTTYRITAHATNEDLYLGVNTKKITSKLDFFVQSTEPRGIKSTDDIVLNATAIADKKYTVDYEFTIKEINKTKTAKGTTNNIVTVNFGSLPVGKYHAIIKGKYGEQEDSIEYEFEVVNSVQEISKKTTISIQNNTSIKPSKNPIVLEIYNKNLNKYIEYIDFIESTQSERLDTQIAYNKVQEVKEKYYGNPANINQIEIYLYKEDGYLKNLRSGSENIVLSALTMYYARESYGYISAEEITPKDNVFEYYLFLAAQGKPILSDLQYLKNEKEIDNYNKLLVTLSLEFVGDYNSTRELYSTISLSKEESEKYKSICAIIDTFINKDNVTAKIDELIKNKPADEYLRFAILSYFRNNSNEIGKNETVKVKNSNREKVITINGMQIEKLTLNNEDLAEITFETDSQDLMISYYYQTLLSDLKDENIKKDIKMTEKGELKKGNTIYLQLDFDEKYEGEVRITLPNSLRLAINCNLNWITDDNPKYYILNNNIDYITLYKFKNCKTIELPLFIINEGKYKMESVVSNVDGVYHISNSLDLNIK